MKRGAENRDFLEPDELAQLQRMFDQTCAEHGIACQSQRAETVATALIQGYQRGLRSDELFQVAAPAMFSGPNLASQSAEAGRWESQCLRDGFETAGWGATGQPQRSERESSQSSVRDGRQRGA
jgi:hypothetical protein